MKNNSEYPLETEGSRIAREARIQCSKHTPEQRRTLIEKAREIIEGGSNPIFTNKAVLNANTPPVMRLSKHYRVFHVGYGYIKNCHHLDRKLSYSSSDRNTMKNTLEDWDKIFQIQPIYCVYILRPVGKGDILIWKPRNFWFEPLTSSLQKLDADADTTEPLSDKSH